MRSTTTAAAVLTATATLTLTAAATAGAADAATAPETHRERGIVLECHGSAGGRSAYVSLYENDVFGDVVQVVLDEDPHLSASRQPHDIKQGRSVATSVWIHGRRARVAGTARAVGRTTAVHETHDDAGRHIVVDGTHRRLRSSLTVSYRGTTVPLACAPAFVYDLQVTTTDAT